MLKSRYVVHTWIMWKKLCRRISDISYLRMIIMCLLVCMSLQAPQQSQVSHPEPVPCAQSVQPSQLKQAAVFSSHVQNGAELGTASATAQLDSVSPCQLPPQAQPQSQVQSQIPVLQSADSQRASSGSASSCWTQQKQLSNVTGAAGQGPSEINMEVWTHLHLLEHFKFSLIISPC